MSAGGGRLAVVVPYRDREAHWRVLRPALGAHLDRAGLDWRLVVVEQADRRPFNRGLLLNAGFALAAADGGEDGLTVCFHDVDLVPEAGCDYSPVDRPTHLAAHVEQLGWELRWEDLFGGVVLFPAADFRRVNGFSNGYWGWGAEDTDLRVRCERAGLAVDRRPGRFRSLDHPPAGDSDRRRRADAAPETRANRRRLDRVLAGELDPAGDGLADLAVRLLARRRLDPRTEWASVAPCVAVNS